MYSLPKLLLLHIIFLIPLLSLVASQYQGCYEDDALYCNATNMDNDQASCDTILLNCPVDFPASSDCVEDWCEGNCADPDSCCTSEDRRSCFQSSPNSSAFSNCTYIASNINSCISATTGFATLPIMDQANCFCFDGQGNYNGYSWDNAATTCYTAMLTQTIWPTNQLDNYSSYYVGACTNFVDTSTLSDFGTRSGGTSATAGPAARVSSSASTTATKTSSIPSGQTTTGTVPPTTTGPTAAGGTPSSRTTVSSTSPGAKNGSEGSGMVLGAFLVICCLIAAFKQ